ncbi:hypothetical protein FJZ21_02050 [Candidatus Pacearchaeota archaeon]|nr:hypothetical protein [Candidatus Pacearchaeota archaeon]
MVIRQAFGREQLKNIDSLDQNGFETVEYVVQDTSNLGSHNLTVLLRADGTKLSTSGQHAFTFLGENGPYITDFLHSMGVTKQSQLKGRRVLGYFNGLTGLVEALYPIAR